eukprot:TRINITY_DN6105_c0_g1_i2.p1 TRINITY_DN6105_c0_g1~~TRINITY_DN6105_c0_g1_i2.p1  ORF type:complete len:201 (+),score=28.60 TRINITY_DN6105_c0_g1_i2:43-603(+)
MTETARPPHHALIVVDPQERFRADASPVLEHINALVTASIARGVHVFITQHHDVDKDGALIRWWNHPISRDSEDWQLLPELHTGGPNHPLVEHLRSKTTYDSFHGTGLEEKLRALGVSCVIVCGCVTNLCCETTARSAFVKGFDVLFPRDANGTTQAAHHEATLLNLSFGFARVCSTDEAIKTLGE